MIAYQVTAYKVRRAPSMWHDRLRKVCLLLVLTALSQCTMQGETKVIVLREGELLVQEGDTVYSVARRYNVNVRELMECNGLTSSSLLKDQKLVLPSTMQEKERASLSVEGPRLLSAGTDVQWTDAVEGEGEISAGPINKRLVEEARKENVQSAPMKEKKTPITPKASSAKLSLRYPLQEKITRKFGASDGQKKSPGIFFHAPARTSVTAAASGKIFFAGFLNKDKAKELLVMIQHQDGWLTAYGPFEKIDVSNGQNVSAGSVLGEAKGSELYFELRNNRQPIDPMPYFQSSQ